MYYYIHSHISFTVLSWKLSRTKELTDEAKARIKVVVDRTNVLNERYYAKIGHLPGDCFYYPELNPTTPVRFPGQCDTTIKTVPDFDVAAVRATAMNCNVLYF